MCILDQAFLSIGGQGCDLRGRSIKTAMSLILLLHKRRNGPAVKDFFGQLLKRQRGSPKELVTDKLGSHRVAHHELMSTAAFA
jgi:transposase-like protein